MSGLDQNITTAGARAAILAELAPLVASAGVTRATVDATADALEWAAVYGPELAPWVAESRALLALVSCYAGEAR